VPQFAPIRRDRILTNGVFVIVLLPCRGARFLLRNIRWFHHRLISGKPPAWNACARAPGMGAAFGIRWHFVV